MTTDLRRDLITTTVLENFLIFINLILISHRVLRHPPENFLIYLEHSTRVLYIELTSIQNVLNVLNFNSRLEISRLGWIRRVKMMTAQGISLNHLMNLRAFPLINQLLFI